MCGIAGFFGSSEFLPSNKAVLDCLKLMKNRGPDFKKNIELKLKKKSLLLLFTRLSIIDIDSKANKIFEDDNGVLIYNGEIYNFLILKKKLIKKGIKFQSKTDTEVLLKILGEYGEEGVSLLDGMWAFAYFSKKKKNYFYQEIDLEKNHCFSLSIKRTSFLDQISIILKLFQKEIFR